MRFSCRNIFKSLNILTVPSLFISKCVHHVKCNPSEYVTSRDTNTNYNFRHNCKVTIPQHRLALVANSPLVLPIKLYNKLPLEIKKK